MPGIALANADDPSAKPKMVASVPWNKFDSLYEPVRGESTAASIEIKYEAPKDLGGVAPHTLRYAIQMMWLPPANQFPCSPASDILGFCYCTQICPCKRSGDDAVPGQSCGCKTCSSTNPQEDRWWTYNTPEKKCEPCLCEGIEANHPECRNELVGANFTDRIDRDIPESEGGTGKRIPTEFEKPASLGLGMRTAMQTGWTTVYSGVMHDPDTSPIYEKTYTGNFDAQRLSGGARYRIRTFSINSLRPPQLVALAYSPTEGWRKPEDMSPMRAPGFSEPSKMVVWKTSSKTQPPTLSVGCLSHDFVVINILPPVTSSVVVIKGFTLRIDRFDGNGWQEVYSGTSTKVTLSTSDVHWGISPGKGYSFDVRAIYTDENTPGSVIDLTDYSSDCDVCMPLNVTLFSPPDALGSSDVSDRDPIRVECYSLGERLSTARTDDLWGAQSPRVDRDSDEVCECSEVDCPTVCESPLTHDVDWPPKVPHLRNFTGERSEVTGKRASLYKDSTTYEWMINPSRIPDFASYQVHIGVEQFDLECDYDSVHIVVGIFSEDPNEAQYKHRWSGGCQRLKQDAGKQGSIMTFVVDKNVANITISMSTDANVHYGGLSFSYKLVSSEASSVSSRGSGNIACPVGCEADEAAAILARENGTPLQGYCDVGTGSCVCEPGRTGEDCSAYAFCEHRQLYPGTRKVSYDTVFCENNRICGADKFRNAKATLAFDPELEHDSACENLPGIDFTEDAQLPSVLVVSAAARDWQGTGYPGRPYRTRPEEYIPPKNLTRKVGSIEIVYANEDYQNHDPKKGTRYEGDLVSWNKKPFLASVGKPFQTIQDALNWLDRRRLQLRISGSLLVDKTIILVYPGIYSQRKDCDLALDGAKIKELFVHSVNYRASVNRILDFDANIGVTSSDMDGAGMLSAEIVSKSAPVVVCEAFKKRHFSVSGGAIVEVAGIVFRRGVFAQDDGSGVEGGGSVLVTGQKSALRVFESRFEESQSDTDGGTFAVLNGGKLSLVRSLAMKSTASQHGGAMILDGELDMDRSYIYGCNALQNGGGIRRKYTEATKGSEALVQQIESAIIGCAAGGGGGGVSVEAGSNVLEIRSQRGQAQGMIIRGNRAEACGGGGVHMEKNSQLLCDTCIIRENSALVPLVDSGRKCEGKEGNGGGIYISDKASMHLLGAVIEDNTATSGDGGGIWVDQPSRLTFATATTPGTPGEGCPGCPWSSKDRTMSNRPTVIVRNKAGLRGAGIFARFAGAAEPAIPAFNELSREEIVDRSLPRPSVQHMLLVQENEAAHSGGGIYVELVEGAAENQKVVRLQGLRVERNLVLCEPSEDASTAAAPTAHETGFWSQCSGGGIVLDSSSAGGLVNTFNYVLEEESNGNGKIVSPMFRLEDSIIMDNSASRHGGGLALAYSKVEIADTRIEANLAKLGNGGGVYMIGSHATFVGTWDQKTSFVGNQKEETETYGKPYIKLSRVFNNVAFGSGGGLALRDGSHVQTERTLFATNTASDCGGNIFVDTTQCEKVELKGLKASKAELECEKYIACTWEKAQCVLDRTKVKSSVRGHKKNCKGSGGKRFCWSTGRRSRCRWQVCRSWRWTLCAAHGY